MASRGSSVVIDFACGQPSDDNLPAGLIERCAKEAFRNGEIGKNYLQYGYEAGEPEFLQELLGYLRKNYSYEDSNGESFQYSPHIDNLMLTAGVSNGLQLLCDMFRIEAKGGKVVVFAESPTYFLAIDLFRHCGFDILPVKCSTEEGISLEYLEKELLQKGKVPTFLYTIPTCHNPLGSTLNNEKRQKLTQLASDYGFYIVADEVYHLLQFESSSRGLKNMFAFNYDDSGTSLVRGTVISLGSFSKILAPGLRIGWMEAEPKIVQAICNRGDLISGGCLPQFSSAIVLAAIRLNALEEYKRSILKKYNENAILLVSTLLEKVPELKGHLQKPTGGYFVWIDLSFLLSLYSENGQSLKETRMLACFEELKSGEYYSTRKLKGIKVLFGSRCACAVPATSSQSSSIDYDCTRPEFSFRLCFANLPKEDIKKGSELLAHFLRYLIEQIRSSS
eukprot:Nk52_evm46s1992 gene=Nk52_evmTU46s1992